MKNITKAVLSRQMAFIFLITGTLATSARAGNQAPFKGRADAVETFDVQFPTMFVDTIGAGRATHLGQFNVKWEFTVNLLNGAGIGSALSIAANGDERFTEWPGRRDPTGTPNVNLVVETHTITGGTGRFLGATGSFTLERLVNIVTGATHGSFEGSICSHAATKLGK